MPSPVGFQLKWCGEIDQQGEIKNESLRGGSIRGRRGMRDGENGGFGRRP